MRRAIYTVTITLGIIFAINLLVGGLLDVNEVPLEHNYLKRYRKWMMGSRANVVLIGNSMLDEGVDNRQMSKLLGQSVIKFAKGGSASAAWYLVLKNVVVPAPKKPKYAVLFFRDHFLTHPIYRVKGQYKDFIDDLSTKSEPLVQELAYDSDRLDQNLKMAFPAYRLRKELRANLDEIVKNRAVSKAVGLHQDGVNHAINQVFHSSKMLTSVVTKQQAAAEMTKSNELFNFKGRVKRTFLPHIIALAEQEDINLIFVRIKRRRDLKPNQENEKVTMYISDLGNYLKNKGIPLLDFSKDPRITLAHFGQGDHLSRETGQRFFTRILSEELRPLIK